jgi:LemA protein
MLIAIIVIAVVIIVLVLILISVNNSMIGARNRVDESWSGIDVQLKRRHDLVPNLVETVKGYAAHERGTLDAVIQARNAAVSDATYGQLADRAEVENALTQSLGRLFALAESYPNLKANENFAALQSELANTEDKIAYARQFYNSAVQSYNTSTQTIPANLIAGLMGFRVKEFFAAAGDERGTIQVRF